jgi:hypothetical protein
VILIVVLNWWLVWPHFKDWGKLRHRLDDARQKLKLYQEAVAQIPDYEAKVKAFEGQGEYVPPEDQAIYFTRTIQTQSSASGVGIVNTSPQMTRTNDAFFVEQILNLNVSATDAQLVDFLYKLGSGASMTRVRDLELQPDGVHQHLTANIKLVASYQKNPTAPANPKSSTAKAK